MKANYIHILLVIFGGAIILVTLYSGVIKLCCADSAEESQGTKTADFTYTKPSGDKDRLWEIESEFTLVYFYNPDCHNCERVRNYIVESPVFESMVKARLLSVLAVYTDRDLDLWRSRLYEIPQEWKVGYNQHLHSDERYDLKAIPMLYLLDKNKHVIQKDTRIEFAEAVLAESNRCAYLIE